MQEVKTYRAYYDDGLFIPYEPVIIPKGCQVVVTVLDFLLEQSNEPIKRNAQTDLNKNPIIIRQADPSKSALGLWEGEAVIPDDINTPPDGLEEYMY